MVKRNAKPNLSTPNTVEGTSRPGNGDSKNLPLSERWLGQLKNSKPEAALIIYVLVDRTVISKGLPARSCFWNRVLTNAPELLSISDSKEEIRRDPTREPIRIDLADIVIVNWDAANGDYACGSDDVYLYFLTREDRRATFLANGGILLCEFQSGKGALHQGAYDVIFGRNEVTVYRARLGQARKLARDITVQEEQDAAERRSHGANAAKFACCLNYCANHPLIRDLPAILESKFEEDGDHIFNFSETYYEAFQGYRDRKSQLWRGWFENWQRGWVPLLVAMPPSEWPPSDRSWRGLRVAVVQAAKSQYERWFKLPRAILLAKIEGNGLMLASTMWIAGSRCQQLADQIVKPDIVKAIRKKHWQIWLSRVGIDLLWLGLIACIYAWLFRAYFFVNPPEETRLGTLLKGAGDVGFTWLAIIALRFWRHFFWNRPYGTNVFQFFRVARQSFWETL